MIKSIYEHMDKECVNLCRALDSLAGIEVYECSGDYHPTMRDDDDPKETHIFFTVPDFSARGLLTLSRIMSSSYYNLEGWAIFLDHKDTDPQVCFQLLGPTEECDRLAEYIRELVEDRAPGYNIYLNK